MKLCSFSRENNSIYRSVIENNRWAKNRMDEKFAECFSFLFLCLFILATLQPILSTNIFYHSFEFYYRVTCLICSAVTLFFSSLFFSFLESVLRSFRIFAILHCLYISWITNKFDLFVLCELKISLLIVRAQMWHVSIATIVRVNIF